VDKKLRGKIFEDTFFKIDAKKPAILDFLQGFLSVRQVS
jgi:hypothetical protein